MTSFIILYGLVCCTNIAKAEQEPVMDVVINTHDSQDQHDTVQDSYNNANSGTRDNSPSRSGDIKIDLVNDRMILDPKSSMYQQYIFSFFNKQKLTMHKISSVSDKVIKKGFANQITSDEFITGYLVLIYNILKNNAACRLDYSSKKLKSEYGDRSAKLEEWLADYRKKIPSEYVDVERELLAVLNIKCMEYYLAHELASYKLKDR